MKDPLNQRNVWKAFGRVVRAAGFPYHFSPHSLRHRFAPLFVEQGESPGTCSVNTGKHRTAYAG